MTDLHDRFREWLQDGPLREVPRDLAVHAAGCPSCLRRAAAIDALLSIDPGAAPKPPVRVVVMRRGSRLGTLVPMLAPSAAVLAVVIAGTVVGSTVFRGTDPEPTAAVSQSPVDERGAVLGDGPDFETAGPTESPDASHPPRKKRRAEPTPTEATPAIVGAPAPVAPAAPITPSPTAATTPAARTPAATPVATASPSPTPVPTPTPPPQCSDGLDNDLDLLVDYPSDLGCSGPEDNDESELPLP
jgi:hypothetical protein